MDSAVTGKSFEKGPEFCFKDLLDLGQYHFADAVSEIVDQSAKESKIEKKLNVIRNTWSKMSVEFNCAREDCPLLAELGDIVETLEVHPLERMQMTSQGSFIEFCRGASGCSDEFNRISIEVLSVVSTQYKSILDAIRENAKTLFMDVGINLIIPIGTFTSMNSGYAGRTELPESSKALFRSCAMIVPDLSFTYENMLTSEGFVIARLLARKFVTLYSLCKDLLSKQMHYDWGLRAVKSLLRQAGKMKQKELHADVNIMLCRALRDFNVPKITTDDVPIFLRLIQDLFPSALPEPFADIELEKTCSYIICNELFDILFVRGCSKTETWTSPLEAVKSIAPEGLWEQVSPKAITSDELYGIMSKTKDWTGGAIAVIMRNMKNKLAVYAPHHQHQWIVSDGDIDAMWIESMNTVMDDNKVLTLVSNERIPFTCTMHLLLETHNMDHASPATVSRGGVPFINRTDVGWKPFMRSWDEQMGPAAPRLMLGGMMSARVNQKLYTSSFAFEEILMGHLDKRAWRTFGPPSKKKYLYFIDDLNMPAKDTFETQSAIVLLTQILSYACICNCARKKERVDLVDVQFGSCMNPNAKSFVINARLLQQNTVLTCFTPTKDIVNATIDTLNTILNAPTFSPSLTKYHFTMKDVSNIFQCLPNTKGELFKEPTKFLPAWMRDGNRVFSDRMVDLNDMTERASVSEKAVTKDKKAVIKPGISHAFLLTGGQISEDRFLVLLNNLLSSGNIPDLFTRELYNGLMRVLRNQAKASGALEASVVTDDRDDTFGFFMDKVGKQLHLILRHSPVADTFRIRERKFPALISCMVIDEFHPWPRDALDDVSSRFLNCLMADGIVADEGHLNSMVGAMTNLHLSIDVVNKGFSAIERRHNYATPKSFLEFIGFYVKMLQHKQAGLTLNVERLEKGLTIIEQVPEKVDGLKEDLQITVIQVEEKKTATSILIDQVTVAGEKAAVEKEAANEEATKTNALADEATAIKAQADGELGEAMPAMETAKVAVNCFSKAAIQELKSLGKPPVECVDICAATAFLLKAEKRKFIWKGAQKMTNNPAQFVDGILNFNANEIPKASLANVAPIITQPFFNFDTRKGKSQAVAYLTNWVVNIGGYNRIYKKVAPLMAKVKEATNTKETAEAALPIVFARVKDVEERVASLDKQLTEAVVDKDALEAMAQKCLENLALEQGLLFIGDSLVSVAFVGYVSPFNAAFRAELWKREWLDDIREHKVPMTDGVDPLTVLASESDIAGWSNEGLPADRISIGKATVITPCEQWPLMIDPRLQDIKWIQQRVGEEFTCIQLTAANWLSKVVYALNTGGNLRIEAIRSEIDAILEPLLSRAVVQRGRNSFIARIGGEEIDYDPKFQLILQSKLPSPKYRPEIAAHCNRINFIVTQELLEDHILAMIVNSDKPELEQENQVLVRSQHRFKVTQAQLEDDLLAQLACADSSTMLDNFPFIEGLAKPKATSTENFIQVKVALETEIQINTLLELYRPVALGGSMLFFVVIQLVIVEHMYQYLLDSLVSFLMEAIDRAPALDDTNIPTALFIVTIGMTIFRWGNRGLSELRKLIFCALLALHIFMRGLMRLGGENPMANFLPNNACFDAQKLIVLEGFESFADNMKKDSRRCCKEWFNEWTPEESKLPFDWKKLYNFPFHKSLVLRGLWPDRTPTALGDWIRNILPNGTNSMDYDGTSSAFSVVLTSSYDVSNNTTPIFFILSPVVPSWCRELGEQTDGFMIEGSRLDFLCFLRADPSPGIPIGLLERSIKLTNAFHQGLLANLRRLFAMFNKEDFENRDAKNIPTN
eukprot:GEMP01000942.1.p1 GENE.GEMP01000942.1~~GEMP01000942.1.p1  ORF type:complete len:1804 (-),score=375.45 GEMP01000942.1:270-5681(-)